MGKTVCVVDDQIGIRLLLKEIVEMMDYEVKDYGTAADALEDLPLVKPDLFFVDFNLPLMDGMEFIKKANEKLGVKVPAVIMSGYSMDELRDKLDMDYIKKVLHKPFDVTDITDLLKTYLG